MTQHANQLRTVWLIRAGESLLALILIVGISYGVGLLKAERAAVLAAQQQLEQAPELLTQDRDAQKDLEKHGHDIARIRTLFVQREAVDVFLSVIEAEGKKHGVDVLITDIQEEEKFGKDKKLIPQQGPYIDVSVTIKAAGDPIQLLEYLHTLEYLPYVLRLATWSLGSGTIFLPPGLAISAPRTVSEDSEVATPQGLLETKLVLTIFQKPQ